MFEPSSRSVTTMSFHILIVLLVYLQNELPAALAKFMHEELVDDLGLQLKAYLFGSLSGSYK